jgi:uncharacterized SAM-binding protein YcdF (DUF218 family)
MNRAAMALLLPSTLLGALCVLGAAVRMLAWRVPRLRRASSALLGTGLVWLAVVFLTPIDVWLLGPLENRFAPATRPPRVDGVVVLGGAIATRVAADRGIPTLDRDADRVTAFAALARAYPDARLVFAGGPPSTNRARLTEAEASRELLDSLGVPPARITVEDQSRTTWENAVNARALAVPRPTENWVLVTSAAHMPRAIGAFRAAGWPEMTAWPVAWRTSNGRGMAILQPMAAKLGSLDLAAHEWVGLVVYRLRGRTDRLLPAP